jgi:hypothetical protein
MPQYAIVKQKTKSESAQSYYSGITSGSNNVWFYFGNPVSWATYPGGSYNDTNPPIPTDNIECEKQIWDGILGLKKMLAEDFSLAFKRVDWVSGNYYDMYRDDYDGNTVQGISLTNTVTKPLSLARSNSLVFVNDSGTYKLYRCIDNRSSTTGNPIASTTKPTFTVSTIQTLADGYKWKYYGTFTTTQLDNFLTANQCPVPTTALTATASGSVVSVVLTSRGTGYTSVPTITIKGDGTGLTLGTPALSGGQIAYIPVTAGGTNYTNVQLTFSGGGTPTTTATARAVLAPVPGGFGYNATNEIDPNYIVAKSNNTTTDYYFPTRGNAPKYYGGDGVTGLVYRTVGLIEGVSGTQVSTNLIRNSTEYRYNPVSGTLAYGDRIYTSASGSSNPIATVVGIRQDTSNIAAVLTVNGSTAVNASTRIINYTTHNLVTGDTVLYSNGGGTTIGGLTNNSTYYVIRVDADNFKLATSLANAGSDTAIAITAGSGTNHTFTENTIKNYITLLQTKEQKLLVNPLVAASLMTKSDNTASFYIGPYSVFNGGSSGTIDLANNTILITAHPWATGDQVVYSNGGGSTIVTAGNVLVSGNTYYVIRLTSNEIKLASNLSNAVTGIAIDFTNLGNGSSHTLTYTGSDASSAAGSVKYTGSIIFSEYRNALTRTTTREKFRFVLEF